VVLLLAAGAAGGGAAFAVASVPDQGGVFHACVQVTVSPAGGQTIPVDTTPYNLRIIDPNATPPQTCQTTSQPGNAVFEKSVSWDQTGPQGPAGTNGTNGSNGAPGATGPAGQTLTISGSTFELANGRALTITGQPTIAPLAVDPNAPSIGTLTLIGGNSVTVRKRKNTSFEIKDYSFGVENSTSIGSGSGGGAGKVKFNEFTIHKTTDQASPLLVKACASGMHFPKVVLFVRKAGGHPNEYLTITLTDALVSSYQAGGHSGSDTPVESVTFNFTKIKFEYKPQK
jgi:type VI secretion system secreted protein Hcp